MSSSQPGEASPASQLGALEAGAIEAAVLVEAAVAVPHSPEGEQKKPAEQPAMFTTRQRLYLFCAFLLGLLFVYLRQTVDGMGGNDLTYTLLVLAIFCLCPRGGAEAEQKDSGKSTTASSSSSGMQMAGAVGQEAGVVGQVAAKKASPSARLHYLDNVKSFMTFIVVMHHILIGYGGSGGVDGFVIGNFRNWFSYVALCIAAINQSYFMCLFFFISGYFTPSSLARKGVRDFMREKLMRLGLPLFAFFFIFNGFIVWFSVTVVLGKSWPAMTWVVGVDNPSWFLQVLLLFNIGLVLCMGGSELPSARCPSPGFLVALGAGLGVVQFFFVKLNFSMWGIPLASGNGSVAFDVLFFIGGCLAKKNRWLEEFQETMRPGSWALNMLRFGTTFMLVVLFFVFAKGPLPHHPEVSPSDSGRRLEAARFAWSVENIGALIFLCFDGVMTMAMSMSVVTLFSFFGNYVSKTSKFFSEAAFGVYIIHAAVWPLVSYTYVEILRASGFQLTFSLLADGLIGSSDDIGTLYVVLGFLYTLTISNLILWPSAFFLRKLPGLRHVL